MRDDKKRKAAIVLANTTATIIINAMEFLASKDLYPSDYLDPILYNRLKEVAHRKLCAPKQQEVNNTPI